MSELTCGSLFSGVGGMDIGFAWAGWRHAFFAEIEPFGRAVLAERFPGVPIYSDVRDVPECERGEWDRLDVLTFGSPCQDLSVAGKRRGLDGDRSGLFWEAMRIAGDGPLRPRALLMENVEGLLSSNGGRDFALVLDAMAERGYRWSYRVLDTQHFGCPQRRRRVFVVGVADDDPRAERIGEVLALAEGGGGDSPTSEPSWPDVAARIGAGAPSSSGRVVGSLTESGGAVTMDHQSFVGGGQYALAEEIGESRVVGCLTDPSRMDEQCVGGGQLVTDADIAATVTAKWSKGSGGPAGAETGNLVVTRERSVATADIVGALTKNNAGEGGYHDNETALVIASDERERERIVVSALQGGGERGYGVDAESAAGGHLVPVAVGGDVTHTLTGEGHDASEDGTGRGTPVIAFPSTGGSMAINADCDRLAPTLRVGSGLGIPSPPAVAFSHYSSDASPGDVSPTMRSGTNVSGHAVQHGPAVRRLTPMECERLQGWPDGWTDIPWNGKPHAPDSKRYAAAGNGVTAPVAYWIAARLAEVLK